MTRRHQRTTHLQGWSVRIDAEQIGAANPTLVIRGTTHAGNMHEIRVAVDDVLLRAIVADVRRHFTERTNRENAHRAWREQAFQQGAG